MSQQEDRSEQAAALEASLPKSWTHSPISEETPSAGTSSLRTRLFNRASLKRFEVSTTSDLVLLLTRLLAVVGLIYLSRTYLATQVQTASARARYGLLRRPHAMEQSLVHHTNGTSRPYGAGSKSIIVASTSKEETSWVEEHFPDWHNNIYVVDDQTADNTLVKNVGREAAVYLTYIINHYYQLPDYMVFLHADRYQWHNEDPMYDGVNPVKNLRLEYVKEVGYASLRCNWNPGCPVGMRPDLENDDGAFGNKALYAHAFQQLFPGEDIPSEVGTTCCAQFALTKEQVLLRPVWQYEKVRQWLWETKAGSGKSGRVMEYMWHILFNKPPTFCPTAESCYCKTFGLCDLTCKGPGSCAGRYHLPPWDKGIPAGWPYAGQGTNGYPTYGWWQKAYPNETWGLEYMAPYVNQTEIVPADGLGDLAEEYNDAQDDDVEDDS